MKRISNIVVFIIILLTLSSCKTPQDLSRKYGVIKEDYYNYLDTISNIVIEYQKDLIKEQDIKTKLKDVTNILLDIETTFSIEQTLYMKQNKIEYSSLMEVNNQSGINPVKVPYEFIEVLKNALDIANTTSNMFNPTIGPLTTLWNISNQAEYCSNSNPCVIPTEVEIAESIKLIDTSKVIIDETESTVFLEEKGMKLDLSGIVKGYAADVVLDYLKNDDFTYISVNLGGNIKTYGKSYLANIKTTNATIVSIGVENPNFQVFNKNIILDVECENMSVVTSGINKRYIEVWDDESNSFKKYHHILNPQTGYPVQNEMLSVTIIGPSSMKCDALSTGVFMLGVTDGINVLNEQNYQGIIVTNDLKIYIVGNIKYTLQTGLEKVYQIINI